MTPENNKKHKPTKYLTFPCIEFISMWKQREWAGANIEDNRVLLSFLPSFLGDFHSYLVESGCRLEQA